MILIDQLLDCWLCEMNVEREFVQLINFDPLCFSFQVVPIVLEFVLLLCSKKILINLSFWQTFRKRYDDCA